MFTVFIREINQHASSQKRLTSPTARASSSSLKWSKSDQVTPGHVAVDCTWMQCNILKQEHLLVVFPTPGTEAYPSCHGARGRKMPWAGHIHISNSTKPGALFWKTNLWVLLKKLKKEHTQLVSHYTNDCCSQMTHKSLLWQLRNSHLKKKISSIANHNFAFVDREKEKVFSQRFNRLKPFKIFKHFVTGHIYLGLMPVYAQGRSLGCSSQVLMKVTPFLMGDRAFAEAESYLIYLSIHEFNINT